MSTRKTVDAQEALEGIFESIIERVRGMLKPFRADILRGDGRIRDLEDAVYRHIQGLEIHGLGDDIPADEEVHPIPVRFERPCFFGGDITKCLRSEACDYNDMERAWHTCPRGALSPHLAEYRADQHLREAIKTDPQVREHVEHRHLLDEEPAPKPAPGTCDCLPDQRDGEIAYFTVRIRALEYQVKEAEARAEKAEVEVTRLTGSLIEAEANAKQWRDAAMEGCTDANALASKWQAVALGERERISKKLMGNANPHVQAVAETVRSLPPPEVKS